MRFGLFFLAEYLGVFAIGCVATVLFLGGGMPLPFSSFPRNLIDGSLGGLLLADAILLTVFLFKVLLFIFVMFWVRATLPRMRIDRLMNFAWKYLVPLSLLDILLAAAWFEVVVRPGRIVASRWAAGMIGIGLLTALSVQLVFWANRKLAAAGPIDADWPAVGTAR
jgi:NADH-quinone oxidoreductase subunit H